MSKKPKKEIINIEPVKTERLINFYELESFEKYKVKYDNPSYDYEKMPLKHPLRGVIVAASGGGKSTVAVQIIKEMANTFEKIYIFTRLMEPIYEWLQEQLGQRQLEVYEGLDYFNGMDLNKDFLECQTLVIFDDLVLEKDQTKIGEIYLRGRKLADNHGISILYLTQLWHKVPRIIRLNSDLVIIKKLNSNEDLRRIVSDRQFGVLTTQEMKDIYNYCIKDNFKHFLMINTVDEKNNIFRKDFDEIIEIKK